jgi:hypothetical protein
LRPAETRNQKLETRKRVSLIWLLASGFWLLPDRAAVRRGSGTFRKPAKADSREPLEVSEVRMLT